MNSEANRQRKRFGKPFEESLTHSDNGCLIWTGRVDKDDYGVRGSRYGERRAHRFAYAKVHGEIPKGIVVMHSCDTPRCCNVNHLSLGTDQMNIQDKVSKGRQARGEKNNHAKTYCRCRRRDTQCLPAWGKTSRFGDGISSFSICHFADRCSEELETSLKGK